MQSRGAHADSGHLSDPTADRADSFDGLFADDCGSDASVVREVAGEFVSMAPGRFPSPHPLFPGCPGLFIQTGSSQQELQAAASLVREERMGILLTMNSRAGNYATTLRSVAEAYKASVGRPEYMLADANRYSGKNRNVGTGTGTNLDPSWIKTQRDLGLPMVLTDSPYLQAGDHTARVAVLTEASSFGNGVVAVLPLHLDWLKQDVEFLIGAVNNACLPVALVLEHTGDPLGVQTAVAGLVRLLEAAEVKVALLRSDLSVLGAVSFGATFGAVGATTGMRHLYPTKPEQRSGFNPGASIAAFVPRSMAYRSLQKINTAIALDLENENRWRCSCRFCYGRMLSYVVDQTQAYQHSLAAIALMGEDVLGGATAQIRKNSWVSRCLHAQTINLEIEADTGLRWDPPAFLGAWHKLATTLPPLTPVLA